MMEKLIKLKSRTGADNYLKQLRRLDGKESKTYVLRSDIPDIRRGYTKEGKKYLAPSGGPLFIEGNYIKQVGAMVKWIDSFPDYGHTITFC